MFTALDDSLTSWSGPVALGIGPNYIDAFVMRLGSTYHVFAKQETTRYVEHATASKLTGPWTFVGKADFAGWGSGMEGPVVVRLDDGHFRMFMDAQGSAGFVYADSADLMAWSTATSLPAFANTVRHGTIIRDMTVGENGASGGGDVGGSGGQGSAGAVGMTIGTGGAIDRGGGAPAAGAPASSSGAGPLETSGSAGVGEGTDGPSNSASGGFAMGGMRAAAGSDSLSPQGPSSLQDPSCGCTVLRRSSAHASWLAGLLGGFGLGRRRRRKWRFLAWISSVSECLFGSASPSAGVLFDALLTRIRGLTNRSASYAALLIAAGPACSGSTGMGGGTASAGGIGGVSSSSGTGTGGAIDRSGASAGSAAGVTSSAGEVGSIAIGGGGTTDMGGGGAGEKDNGGSAGMSSEAGSAGTTQSGSCAGLFCEDFEGGTIDPSVWNIQQNGKQTSKVETELVAHGKYAVQFHGAPNVQSYDFIITRHAPVALAGHHYGRAYFYVTKPPQEHTEFLFSGSSGFPQLKYLEVSESNLGWQLTYVQQVAPTGENYKPASGALPIAKWVCLEWEMNDMPDQISLSVDGTKQVSFDNITFMNKSSGLVGGFTDFGFGYYIWHPVTYAFDVFYDDIVLDTKPIGCLPQ